MLKITAYNKQDLFQYLENVLNVACVLANGGSLPNSEDIENPQQRGLYWWREDNRIHLCSSTNNYWGNIIEETKTSITIKFSNRYNFEISKVLTQLLHMRFSSFTQII